MSDITFGARVGIPALALVLASGGSVFGDVPDRTKAEAAASAIVGDFAAACPIAPLGDEAARRACEVRLEAADFERHLRPILFWGGEKPGVAVKDAELTRFGQAIWTRLYLSLFVTDGTAESLAWDDANHAWRLRVHAAFRNLMAPGQYPYPFWHAPAKWDAYERNQAVDFLIGPEDGLVWAAFREPVGDGLGRLVARHVEHAFDGKSWLWTDENGVPQPAVSLFSGYYRAENPEQARLDATYRDLALELRERQCSQCHVPSNPSHMKKLVLLQTPAHAADMIDRVVAAVDLGDMPWSDIYDDRDPLTGLSLERFMAKARAFQDAVHAAEGWEQGNPPPAGEPP